MFSPFGGLPAEEVDAALSEYAKTLPKDERKGFKERFWETNIGGLLQSIAEAVTLPGDVYAGKVDPMSDEAIGRSFELAGLLNVGAGASTAPRGAIRSGAARVAPDLPMDDSSRMARASSAGYDDATFYRGDKGKTPMEYPKGAHFTRDPNYNGSGFGENREFRLNLQNAFLDDRPVTAAQFGRLIESAQKHDPKLADNLAAMVGKDADWVIGYGKARPDSIVDDGGAHIRYVIERSAAPEQVFKDAGFDAIGSGHEIRKLTGDGIRSVDAAFDPALADRRNIMYSNPGGVVSAPFVAGQQEYEPGY